MIYAIFQIQGHSIETSKYIKVNQIIERTGLQMTNKQFFYGRVSTREQNADRQIKAAKDFGIEERDIYIDKKSGKDFDREQYQILKGQLRSGDLLTILSIDRLGRDYFSIVEQWREITSKGVDIVVLDMPILDTRNKDGGLTGKFISDLFLQILSYVAEIERENIRSRQKQGIEIAKAQGKYKGRKPISVENFPDIYNQWKSNLITARKAMELLGGIKPNTFYRRVKEYEGTL